MPTFAFSYLLNNFQDIKLLRLINENQIAQAVRFINSAADIRRVDRTKDFERGQMNYTKDPFFVYLNNNARQILTMGFDANLRANDIFSQSKEKFEAPIHLAAQKGLIDIVRMLLNKAARAKLPDYVNIKDAFGRTPLYYAAMLGHEETIRFLLNAGADAREKEYNRQQDSSDILLREKTYRYDTLEMLASVKYNPEYERVLNLAVSLNDERAVKESLAFHENILAVNHDILIRNAHAAGNPLLTNYLNFAIEINNLRKHYHIIFMQSFNSAEEKNEPYLDLLKAAIELSKRYNQSAEDCTYNIFASMQLLTLIGAIVSNIDYKSRDKCYKLIPWQNLETLKYTIHTLFKDDSLKKYFATQMLQIILSLQVIGENLNHIDRAGNIIPQGFLPDENFARNIQPLQAATDLTADLRIIQKIAGFTDFINEINISAPYSADRYALIAMLKQIGEFSKHSNQCRNLSPAIKSLFDEIPWKILEELRDFMICQPFFGH